MSKVDQTTSSSNGMYKKYEERDPALEELRRALGPVAANYTNAQLRHLDKELDFAAEFLLDLYCWRKAHPKQGPDQNGSIQTRSSSPKSEK